MNIIYDCIYSCCKKLWLVNPKGSGLRTDILKPLISMFNGLIVKHNKLWVFRFDSHLKQPINSKDLSRFFEKANRNSKSEYGSEMYYFWVREQENSIFQHYHVVVFINGSVVQRAGVIQPIIEKHWKQHGTCYFLNFHQVRRGFQKTIDNVSEHISYLAKVRSKDKNPPASKNFGHSQFKK